MADRVDAPVDPEQTTALHAPPDRVLIQSCLRELRQSHDSVLPRRDLSDERVWGGGSNEKVGLRATCACHPPSLHPLGERIYTRLLRKCTKRVTRLPCSAVGPP